MTANGAWIVVVDTDDGPDGPTYWRCPFPTRRAAVAEMRRMQRVLRRIEAGRFVSCSEGYDDLSDIWYGRGEYPVHAFSLTTSIWIYQATEAWQREQPHQEAE